MESPYGSPFAVADKKTLHIARVCSDCSEQKNKKRYRLLLYARATAAIPWSGPGGSGWMTGPGDAIPGLSTVGISTGWAPPLKVKRERSNGRDRFLIAGDMNGNLASFGRGRAGRLGTRYFVDWRSIKNLIGSVKSIDESFRLGPDGGGRGSFWCVITADPEHLIDTPPCGYHTSTTGEGKRP